jgi:YVTN family beta-propeller protein
MRHTTGLFAAAMAAMLLSGAATQAADTHLVVGDVAAGHVYVYSVPKYELLANFENIVVGSHSGVIALPDGRVLMPDERNKQLAVIKLDDSKAPQIVARVPMPIPLADIQGWGAVSPDLGHYFSVSLGDSEIELLTIVDLTTYTPKQLKVNTGDPAGELHVAVGGDPAVVILHMGTETATYPLSTLLASGTAQSDLINGKVLPSSKIPVGQGGHSDSFSTQLGIWTGTTLRGMEVARLTGGRLVDAGVISWNVDGLNGGRNARERMTADGRHVFGPLNAPAPSPAEWASVQVDLHWANLADRTGRRISLATGVVGRGGVSEKLAVYPNVSPNGDFAILLDVNPRSETFRDVVARVPLDRLSDGPVVGSSTAGRQARHAAITPDGALAFVTHGGDGLISVIDTATKRVVDRIKTPTPLRGGGYIIAPTLGAPVLELQSR